MATPRRRRLEEYGVEKTAVICRRLMWVLLVLMLAMQALVIVSIQMNNWLAEERQLEENIFQLTPLILAVAIMLAGALLFGIYKKRRYIGLILCTVAAVVFFLLAFEIQRAYPTSIGADGNTKGITTFRMIYRHMSPVLLPLLMLVSWLTERAAARRKAAHPLPEDHFDLSGGPLFRDESSSGKESKDPLPSELAGSARRRKKARC